MLRRASPLLVVSLGLFACIGDSPIGPPQQDGGTDGPGPNDVQGIVVDQFNVPIDGIPVRIDEQLLTTANGGKFFAANARAKYDAFAGAAANGKASLVGYRELSTRTPTLHLRRFDVPSHSTTFSGSVTGSSVPLTGCVFTLEGYSSPSLKPSPQFALVGTWYDFTPKVRLLVYPATRSNLGYDVVDETVTAVSGAQPLGALSSVSNTGASYTWNGGGTMGLTTALLVGADGTQCLVTERIDPPINLPSVPSASARLTFSTTTIDKDIGYLVKSTVAVAGADFGALTAPAIASLATPAQDGPFDETTVASWQGGTGSYSMVLDCPDYRAEVVTQRTSATFPDVKTQNDLSALRPRGATCGLTVTATSTRSSSDEWAVPQPSNMSSYSTSSRSVKSSP